MSILPRQRVQNLTRRFSAISSGGGRHQQFKIDQVQEPREEGGSQWKK
jgi:hypothetical protein